MSAALVIPSLLLAATALAAAGPRIPFTLSRDKVILPVTVAGSRPLRIILDTGMGYDGLLIFNSALLDSIALPFAAQAKVGGAGAGPGQQARVADSASFKVGPVELADQLVIVLVGDAFRGFPTDGVTGYSLFGHHAVSLDYGRMEMTLRPSGGAPPGEGWTELPLTVKPSGLPWVELAASTDGRDSVTLACYVDLASSETVEFLTREGQRFAAPDSAREVVLGRGLSGEIRGARAEVAWVRLGPHRVAGLEVAFTPAAARSKQAGADAVIGNGFLHRFDCVFDYGAGRLYVRPNAHFDGGR